MARRQRLWKAPLLYSRSRANTTRDVLSARPKNSAGGLRPRQLVRVEHVVHGEYPLSVRRDGEGGEKPAVDPEQKPRLAVHGGQVPGEPAREAVLEPEEEPDDTRGPGDGLAAGRDAASPVGGPGGVGRKRAPGRRGLPRRR